MMAELEERTRFIGGSDIAAILGLSRWKTMLQVWAEKTGAVAVKDQPTLQKTLGTRLEEVVAELFTEKTGLRVQRANERRVHPKYPHFRAQIDRLVVGADETVECKTTSAFMAKEWADDEIPQEYICQAMWGLAVTGRKRSHIPVLIGNQDFRIKVVDRDPVLIAEMLKRANYFWETFVIPKLMPGQVTAADAETLYALFPQAEPDSQVDLGDDAAKIIEVRNAVYQDLIQLEKQVALHDNELKALLKDKEAGLAGKWKILWKNQKRKGFTVEPTEFRRFTIKELKGDLNGNS